MLSELLKHFNQESVLGKSHWETSAVCC